MDRQAVRWQDDPVLAAIYAYWDRRRAGRAMPSRRDIDPVELGAGALPHVLLTEAVAEGDRRRFRFRLAGTALKQSAGLDLTGHYVDTVNRNPGYTAYIEGLYLKAMQARRPVFSSSMSLAAVGDSRRATRRLICPLSDDGAAVNMFLCGQTFQAFGADPVPTMSRAERFDEGIVEVIQPA